MTTRRGPRDEESVAAHGASARLDADERMRLLRTVANLHPIQIAARVPHLVVARALAFMPRAFAPKATTDFPSPPRALARVADAERDRGARRLSQLPNGSRLRDYEATYGLELGSSGVPHRIAWRSRVALEPYPASVRARRLAVAIRLGRPKLVGELARACRAVLVQPELHLLANHLLENGFALTCGAAVTSGIESDAWHKVGVALLDWQLPEQFLSDGGHFERTASYHVGLTHALLETIELTRASGRDVPEAWLRIAKRALRWMDEVHAPDGSYPLFNDAALDSAPTIDAVRALGAELGLIEPLHEKQEIPRAIHLPQTGWVLLRTGGAMVAFDAGADGASYQPGHVHADALTVELWIAGQRVVVDYGVASYAQDEARARSRATSSHNTVEIDGQDSSEVWSAFRVGRRARARLHELRDGRDEHGRELLVADASHDGYAFLPGSPLHARRLELRDRSLTIDDEITRAGDPSACSIAGRLRVDREAFAAAGASIEGSSRPSRRSDVWFSDFAVERPAEVFEQRGLLTGARLAQNWRVRW